MSIEFWQINPCVDSVHFSLVRTLSVHFGNRHENGYFTYESYFYYLFSMIYVFNEKHNHSIKCSRALPKDPAQTPWKKNFQPLKTGQKCHKKTGVFSLKNRDFLVRKSTFQKPY
ncbi:hypothetical protein [Pseudomonas sp. TUM22785]|uniref:hypothetical protein n=1 Tax=Pseudomonas sp. TUM22785 TaxID=3019098 RepID=UPI002305BFAE|nr:hypothetical protein [Pseudomonas sp. TUM22785]WCD83237.1 hypothetical protein PI990_14795 [Pseudomonas sp. TUM22785]